MAHRLTFRIMCQLGALVFLVLTLVLWIAPHVYVGIYGVGGDAGAQFMGQRSAPLLLGFAVLLWLFRDETGAVPQRRICYSLSVVFTGIAVTGVWAFAQGAAGVLILGAAVVEIIIAGCFMRISQRR